MHELEVWMPSYTGNDIAHKPARMKRGEELHRRLYDKLGGRPLTLEETHAQVARWFAEYENRPQLRTHLHGKTPAQVFQDGRGEGLSPQDEQRLTLLMMQKEVRTITKDGFRLNGRLFWHERLASRRHPVLVRYDEHFSPDSVLVYTLDGDFICRALDRERHGIAYGLHPAAAILGTPEKSSAATMRSLLQDVVLPETRARMTALTAETPRVATPRVIPLPKAPVVTPEAEAALAAAKEAARKAMDAAPGYTPSDLKRWKDSQERYAYLFSTRYERGVELVPADAAWMEGYEATPEYERYLKRRDDALRDMYTRQRGQAVQSA